MIVRVNIVLNRTVVVWTTCAVCGIVIFRVRVSCVNTINWCDTTHFDSEDDDCSGCRNVTVNNNSPIQDYIHPDNQTQPT